MVGNICCVSRATLYHFFLSLVGDRQRLRFFSRVVMSVCIEYDRARLRLATCEANLGVDNPTFDARSILAVSALPSPSNGMHLHSRKL